MEPNSVAPSTKMQMLAMLKLRSLKRCSSSSGFLMCSAWKTNPSISTTPRTKLITTDMLVKLPVVATGGKHLNGVADMAFITVYFPGDILAHINVNWLSPVKVRTMLIGGEDKMLLWNDVEPDEKIKVYDKGVSFTDDPEQIYQMRVGYRTGDVWAPRLDGTEALHVAGEHFVDCIVNGTTPQTDGHLGLRVVELIEAATSSMRGKGETVYIRRQERAS